MGDHDGTIKIEYVEVLQQKQNLFLTRFGGKFGTLRFDDKSFF